MGASARVVVSVTLSVIGSGLGGPAGALAPAAEGGGGRPVFVIGAPGRLDAADDRRLPRRYEREDAPGGAYVDVEAVVDPTWLTQEIERYARAYDCAGIAATWCRREVRALGAGAAIYVAVGERAELVWRAGGNRAVRLAWRRIVETPTGTMTRETPPAEFAGIIEHDFPSQLAPADVAAADAHDFTEREIDRLVYYLDRALEASTAADAAAAGRDVERFVSANLRSIDRLRASGRWNAAETAMPAVELAGGEIASASGDELAERLAALRRWQAEGGARLTPAQPRAWCAERSPLLALPGDLALDPR